MNDSHASPPPALTNPVKLNLAAEFLRLGAPQSRAGLRYRDIGNFHVETGSSVGIAILDRSASEDFWEVHDDGDELLLVMSGKAIFKIRQPDGTTRVETLRTGECILIPRGYPHSSRVLEETAILFMTPRVGSRTWEESPEPELDLDEIS